jgi:hypothetical protein
MKITLLAWNGVSHEVNIPDDTEYITGQVISGDMVLEYPVHYDTGARNRIMDFNDGSFRVARKDFDKLEKLTDPYEIFELDSQEIPEWM